MSFIFFAALCSVAVSIVLKQFKQRDYAVLQMIVWNYVTASILCWLWFKPDFTHLSLHATPWWLIGLLGMLLPTIFFCLAKSLQHAGIIKTEVAQRLSVVLSLLAAYFIFHEQFSSLKLWGVVLGVVAVLSLIAAKTQAMPQAQSSKAGLFLASVWVGYALIDILLKYNSSLGQQFALSLNLMFMLAGITSAVFVSLSKQQWQAKNFPAGMLLGVLNFANIALYVQAHQLLKDAPAVVFVVMNVSVVTLGVLSGLLYFKEKPNLMTVVGLLLSLIGVACLAMSMA